MPTATGPAVTLSPDLATDVVDLEDLVMQVATVPGADVDVNGLSVAKRKLRRIASIQVARCFRNQEVPVTQKGIDDIAALQVQLGGAAILEIRGAVHGDDFYVLGPRKAVDEMEHLLRTKYSCRLSHRVGFGSHCQKTATVLNRVVSVGREGGRKYVQIEPDARHTDLIVNSLGLDGANSKSAILPRTKLSDAEVEERMRSPLLPVVKATQYRSCVMRGAFLAQDRIDVAESVKSLAQGMARPTEGAWEDLKHFARYLKGRPYVATRYWQQTLPTKVLVSVDSDHAGDKLTRKSTTGMVLRMGSHRVKTTSNLQTAIGLNVSEAECYALCHGSAHGLGFQAYLADLSIPLPLEKESDSTSAKSLASRKGLGKQRHVQTRYHRLQDQVASGAIAITKIPSGENVSGVDQSCIHANTGETFGDAGRSRLQEEPSP